MKINKIFLFLFLILLLHCSDREEVIESSVPPISSYRMLYMDYSESLSDLIYLNYENKRISRRTTDYTTFSATAPSISVSKYDEVTYNGNTINIVSKSAIDNIEISGSKEKIILDGDKISTKIYYMSFHTRTSKYYYAGENISKIRSTLDSQYPNYMTYQKDFFYNSKNNLDSIVTRRAQYNYSTQAYELDLHSEIREVELFTNYDDTPNPAKGLKIFEETYNRSLSENNYSDYRKISYYGTAVPGNLVKHWKYIYTNGIVDLSK